MRDNPEPFQHESAPPGLDLARIRGSRKWRAQRIETIACGTGKVVVKGQRPARNGAGLRFLRWCARGLCLPALLAVPMPGGAAAQETEVRRLQQMAGAGVPVPRVLHVEGNFFVMQHLAGPDLARLLATDPVEHLPAWERGLHFILDAHARGQYFGQATARNLVAAPEGIAAVDFEEDPLQVMSLPHAQARDWLLYLHSTAWLLMPGMRRDLVQVWESVVRRDDRQVVRLTEAAARRLGWLRHLPDKRRPWGRDIVSLQAAASFLYHWSTRRRTP